MTTSPDVIVSEVTYARVSADVSAKRLAMGVLSLAVVCGTIAIIIDPSQFGAQVMATASFLILFRVTVQRSKSSIVVVALALFAHHIAAYIHSYVRPLPGADVDALNFHRMAAQIAQGHTFAISTGADFFVNALAAFYRVTAPSLVVGSETSVLAFAAATLLLFSLCDLLAVRRYAIAIYALFAFLPPALFFTSVTLREAWEILFTLWAFRSVLLLRERVTLRRVVALVFSTALMASLHYALAIYAFAFAFAGVLWAVALKPRARRLVSFAAAAMILAVAIVGSLSMASTESIRLMQMKPSEMSKVINEFRLGESLTRATYRELLDVSSPAAAIRSSSRIVFFYWFAPLPHQVENASDAYAMFEGILRALLIVSGLGVALRRAKTEEACRIRFVFWAAIALEMMWALGTTNWGTSIRHRLLAFPILLLVGVPPLLRWLVPERREPAIDLVTDRCA